MENHQLDRYCVCTLKITQLRKLQEHNVLIQTQIAPTNETCDATASCCVRVKVTLNKLF